MPKLRAGEIAQSMAAFLRPNSFFASARRTLRSNCSRQLTLPSYFSLGKTTTIVGELPNTWRKRDEAGRFSRMRGGLEIKSRLGKPPPVNIVRPSSRALLVGIGGNQAGIDRKCG